MKKMINYHTRTYRCGHEVGNEYEMIEAEITIENKSNVIPLFNDYQKLTLQ